MNAQVKLSFRLRSTLFCRFRVRRRFRFVAFAFKKCSHRVPFFISSRYCFIVFAFRSIVFHSVPLWFHSISFCSFPWHLRCKAVGIHEWLLTLLLTFIAEQNRLWTCSCCLRLSSVIRAFICFSQIRRPFFVDLSSVFRGFVVRFLPVLQAFTISMLYDQCSFCASVCAEQKWKGAFWLRVWLLAVHRATEHHASAL